MLKKKVKTDLCLSQDNKCLPFLQNCITDVIKMLRPWKPLKDRTYIVSHLFSVTVWLFCDCAMPVEIDGTFTTGSGDISVEISEKCHSMQWIQIHYLMNEFIYYYLMNSLFNDNRSVSYLREEIKE